MERSRAELLRELDAWEQRFSRQLHRWAGITLVRQFLMWVQTRDLTRALQISAETKPVWGDHEFVPSSIQEWAARAWVALCRVQETGSANDRHSILHAYFAGEYGNSQVHRIRDPEAALRDFYLLPIFLQLRAALEGPIAFHADVARWVQRVDAWGLGDLKATKEQHFQDDLERWLFDQGWSLGALGTETQVGNGRVDFLLQDQVRAVVELKLHGNLKGVEAQAETYRARADAQEVHIVVINTDAKIALKAPKEPVLLSGRPVHLHAANPRVTPSQRQYTRPIAINDTGALFL